MTEINKPPSYIHLASTNCSAVLDETDNEEKPTSKPKNKKRIGPYTFHTKNKLGSGYSGSVYKAIKDNNKNFPYAVKVIKTKDMKTANSHLLKTEISILQELDHPNVVKLLDVLHSSNHCYLITQYCEGGDLEQYASQKENIEWGSIVHQVSQGCQYLASKNIVHRDLKPANIFLKNGTWKIGDFGFAKKISHSGALIIEGYKVGSPLYMPLETLERNMYSIKSDSYSLGVIIYYLITKTFPYHGKDVSRLIKCTQEKEADFKKFETLPVDMLAVIKGLLDREIRSRLLISKTDFSIFLAHKSIGEINQGLLSFKHKITEQVILCQFINYLMKNSVHFLEDDHILYSLMSDNLYHLTEVFEWQQSKCLREMKTEYVLPSGSPSLTDQLYHKILRSLESELNLLKFREDSDLCLVAMEKILQYHQIVKSILLADIQSLGQILKTITLHQSFENLSPDRQRISQLLVLLKQ